MLDAAFAYLIFFYSNDIEKQQGRGAVNVLSQYWRKLGLGDTLKAHIMEHHECSFNDMHGIGDKEESFEELGHQVGARENSIINACLQASRPLVMKQKLEVLQATKKEIQVKH